MASYTFDPTAKTFRIQFRYGGKQFNRSLRTRNEAAAEAACRRVEETIGLILKGRLEVPDGADPGTFILSDGKLAAKPVIAAPPPAGWTLKILFEEYDKALPPGAKEANTLRTEAKHREHALRLLGDVAVSSIGLEETQGYANRRGKERYRGRTTHPETIRKELKTLRRIWCWGHKRGKLPAPNWQIGDLALARSGEKEPFRTMAEIRQRIERGGLSEAEQKSLWECLYLTREELAALLDHVRSVETDLFVYPMFCFCALTGARRSELLRSRIDDIDLRHRKVLLREKKRVKGKMSTRSVDLHPRLERVIRQWLAEHPGGQFTLCQADGSPLNVDLMDHRFEYALRGSKWEVIRGFHTLRHSFASILASQGVDQRIINAFMGHQTPEQEARYRHLFPARLRSAIEELLPEGQ